MICRMMITSTVLLIIQLLLTVLKVYATRHRLSLHLIFHLPIILQNFILLCGVIHVINPQFVIFAIVNLFVCPYVFAVIVLYVVPHAYVLVLLFLMMMQLLNFVEYFIGHVLLV